MMAVALIPPAHNQSRSGLNALMACRAYASDWNWLVVACILRVARVRERISLPLSLKTTMPFSFSVLLSCTLSLLKPQAGRRHAFWKCSNQTSTQLLVFNSLRDLPRFLHP